MTGDGLRLDRRDRALPDPPGISRQRWIDLIRDHPNFVPPEPVKATSPFTKRSMVIRPLPDVARVVVDGEAVAPLAQEVAKVLGGRFRASKDQVRR